MGNYAESTTVNRARSIEEIERILQRYGAERFMYGSDTRTKVAAIGFTVNNRMYQITVPLPDKNDKEFLRTETGRTRTRENATRLYEQTVRQRWRIVVLLLKAKFEAIDLGVSSFRDEFLAYTLLPDGSTLSQWVQPKLVEAYSTGKMPNQLLLP